MTARATFHSLSGMKDGAASHGGCDARCRRDLNSRMACLADGITAILMIRRQPGPSSHTDPRGTYGVASGARLHALGSVAYSWDNETRVSSRGGYDLNVGVARLADCIAPILMICR